MSTRWRLIDLSMAFFLCFKVADQDWVLLIRSRLGTSDLFLTTLVVIDQDLSTQESSDKNSQTVSSANAQLYLSQISIGQGCGNCFQLVIPFLFSGAFNHRMLGFGLVYKMEHIRNTYVYYLFVQHV